MNAFKDRPGESAPSLHTGEQEGLVEEGVAEEEALQDMTAR